MPKEELETVLIPSKFSASCYACLRSLAPREIRTIATSAYENAPVFSSRYCDEAIVTPPPHEDLFAYKEALLAIAARADVRTIIPTFEVDTYLLSKYRDEFEKHVKFVVPSLDRLRTVHDRVELVRAAREAGVPVPETRTLDEVEDWDRRLIVKSRYNVLVDEYVDSYSPDDCEQVKNVIYFRPGDDPDRNAIHDEMKHVPIVQEFVPTSDEYLFGALYDHGEAVATFQHRQVRGETYAGGGGSYRESVDIPRLEEAGRKLLDHLEWHGLACIEYMEDARTGEMKLTEINPRIWRSLPFAVQAGADFPYYYWLLANGRPEAIEHEYEVGRGGHLLHGEFTYLHSVLFDDNPNVEPPSIRATLRDIVSSCYDQPNFDYLHRDDPGPFLRGIVNEIPAVGDFTLGERTDVSELAAADRDRDAEPEDTPDRGRPSDSAGEATQRSSKAKGGER